MRPLPSQIDDDEARNLVEPSKDIDGITDISMAELYSDRGGSGFPPCTPQACIRMLDHYGIDIAGKRACVLGRSTVVGKPVAMMLVKRDATVTICHSKTRDAAKIANSSDILIAAVGHAHSVGKEYFAAGQTVIDVGINMDENGKLCGDVDSGEAEGIADAITPVPGGVGTVTSSILMLHVAQAAWQRRGR